ncbi:MAG: hypothetical protein CL569_12915 [Alphaproteobacteria bacterium]|nr:hypothetical protein [Alphaproteobacteria bacterium]|tara:strand:+ start:9105 stop:9821 length:717 start_codon:yes stop_codon:yes gene_type:complete
MPITALYADSYFPVGSELEAVHASQPNQLGKPGSWGTGAQRLAVVIEARQACFEAGVLDAPQGFKASSSPELPQVAREFIRELAVSPMDVTKDIYDDARANGLSDPEYVEIVGLVGQIRSLDVFARGIGVPLRSLPPAQDGEPSKEFSESVTPDGAWVPMVPKLPEGGETARALYGENPRPNIIRALSLIPAEMRAHIELEEVQYLPGNPFSGFQLSAARRIDPATGRNRCRQDIRPE